MPHVLIHKYIPNVSTVLSNDKAAKSINTVTNTKTLRTKVSKVTKISCHRNVQISNRRKQQNKLNKTVLQYLFT